MGTDRVQRRDHRGAGRQPIVDDDDHAARRIDRRARGRVRRAPSLHRRPFHGHLSTDVVGRGACGLRILADVGPAGFVDGADRVLGIAGSVQLPREHDVEFSAEALCDQPAHRHRPARNGQHERICAPPRMQRARELFGGVDAVAVDHAIRSLVEVDGGQAHAARSRLIRITFAPARRVDRSQRCPPPFLYGEEACANGAA